MARCCASRDGAPHPYRRNPRKHILLWGKAGQRSLARSALIEGVSQLGKALGQIATLPGSATLRREQIRLQVALANALMHVKGYAAPDTVDVEA